MNEGFSKAKIVGFITIILILAILVIIALKLVSVNQKKQKESSKYITYEASDIVINLNGDYIEYVSLGKLYQEKGVVASKDKEDISNQVIKSYYKDNNQVSSIDTSTTGNYLIQYTYLDTKNNKAKSIYRTVIVVDNQKPIIKFPEITTISKDEVKDFDFTKEVVVSDNSSKVDFTYEGTLEEKEGSYIITYTAVDSSGNKTTKKRLIKVT